MSTRLRGLHFNSESAAKLRCNVGDVVYFNPNYERSSEYQYRPYISIPVDQYIDSH